MKQRVRPLLLMRKRSAAAQNIGGGMLAHANKMMDDTLFGSPRYGGGWTGTAYCASASDVLVEAIFTGALTWTDTGHAGVSIVVKVGPSVTKTFTITGPAAATSNALAYTGSWDTPPVFGDKVYLNYDGPAGTYTYVDNNGDVQDLPSVLNAPITNCSPRPLGGWLVDNPNTGSGLRISDPRL